MLKILYLISIVILSNQISLDHSEENIKCYKSERLDGVDYLVIDYSDSTLMYINTRSRYQAEPDIVTNYGIINDLVEKNRFEIKVNEIGENGSERINYGFDQKIGEIVIKKRKIYFCLNNKYKHVFKLKDCSDIDILN
jgi:hypothetical protein